MDKQQIQAGPAGAGHRPLQRRFYQDICTGSSWCSADLTELMFILRQVASLISLRSQIVPYCSRIGSLKVRFMSIGIAIGIAILLNQEYRYRYRRYAEISLSVSAILLLSIVNNLAC
jgi:hypothetical protein